MAHPVSQDACQNKNKGGIVKQVVMIAGQAVGYVEHVRRGELWRAVAYGKSYPPPMFGLKGDALQFVRNYGRPVLLY